MFDKIIIIDESDVIEQNVVLSPNRPRAFIPIFSQRGFGKDSEIKLFKAFTQTALVRKYGTPNVATTMLPMYYAYNFLRGGGDVYLRRITSATSAYAHAVIVAKGKVVTDKYNVTFGIETLAASVNLETMITDAEALYSATPDEDGNKTFPIAIIGMNWSGIEGNKFTFRLLPNKGMDKEVDVKTYQTEIKESTSAVPVNTGFSLDSNAMLDGISIYSNDIFDETAPDYFFNVLAGYKLFLADIEDYIPAAEVTKPDIFFGKEKDGTAYPDYVILGTSVDFTAVGGIPFEKGSDGNFASSVAERQTNMMTRLADSFEEEATKILENEYKYFVDFVYDFGAVQDVKDALTGFVGRRQSTKAIIDTGYDKGSTAILNKRLTGDLTYNDMKITLCGGIAIARDPFNNKKITVPLSYFEAYAIPRHITTYEGGARPFAGALYTYDNMLAGTYQPYFYDENSDIVESFVDNRINFAMEDSNGYQAFHQSTTVKLESALAERNNVFLLHKMVRIGLLEAKAERWNFAEDADIEKYEGRLKQRIGNELEGRLGSFDLVAEREGTIGAARNRVKVALTVRFKYINKGTTFTFTVI